MVVVFRAVKALNTRIRTALASLAIPHALRASEEGLKIAPAAALSVLIHFLSQIPILEWEFAAFVARAITSLMRIECASHAMRAVVQHALVHG